MKDYEVRMQYFFRFKNNRNSAFQGKKEIQKSNEKGKNHGNRSIWFMISYIDKHNLWFIQWSPCLYNLYKLKILAGLITVVCKIQLIIKIVFDCWVFACIIIPISPLLLLFQLQMIQTLVGSTTHSGREIILDLWRNMVRGRGEYNYHYWFSKHYFCKLVFIKRE